MHENIENTITTGKKQIKMLDDNKCKKIKSFRTFPAQTVYQ